MKTHLFRRLAGVVCVGLCVLSAAAVAQEEDVSWPTLAELRAKAEGGDVRAMVDVAHRYDWGNDGEAAQDFAEARAWYEKAAAKGDGYAAYQIAGMFREGRGVEMEAAKAFAWMQRAAEAGLGVAQVGLAEMHERAEGTRKNLVEALKWYEKAAEQHEAEAMYRAGLAYAEGRGTKKDHVAAAKWLLRASQNWNEDAGAKLWELRNADPELGAKMLAAGGAELQQLLARANAGDAKAQVALAEKLQDGDSEIFADDAAAAGWWAKAAELGEPTALREMGRRYLSGEGVERNFATAERFLNRAVERGDVAAYFWLGAARDDYGEESNPEEAAKYYRLAAERGDVTAQRRLAENLESGRGVAKGAREALKWYGKAAEQGDVTAMMQAAMLASSAQAGVQDFALARKWLLEARKHNHPDTDLLLENLERDEAAARLAKDVPAHVPAALREMFVAALRGDSWAQWQIATRYSKGEDGMPRDEVAFEMWRGRAAESGRLEAQESLGLALTERNAPQRNVAEGVKQLEQAAAAGLSAARFRLAELLATGDGVEKNESRAVELFEHEARANHREAMWRLRQMHAQGIAGAAPDEKKAGEWLMRAALAGHPEAKAEEAKLAAAKAAGVKAVGNTKLAEAERTLDLEFAAALSRGGREAAVKAFSRAIVAAGKERRWTLAQTCERVLQTLLPKMQQMPGEAGAYVLALDSQAYDPAVVQRVLPANVMAAVRTYAQQVSSQFQAKQAALGPIQSLIPGAESGDVAKQMQVAKYFLQNHAAHDVETALRWYKRAADAGHAPAREQIKLATAQLMERARASWQAGRGEEAIVLAKKVAEWGDAEAMLFLGAAYLEGGAIPKNFDEAKIWLTKAKAAGSEAAQDGLDFIARGGEPGAPDLFVRGMAAYREKRFSDALAAWEQAAEAGHPEALFNIGVLHELGEGVPKDNAKALAWFERAAAKQAKNAAAAVARVKVNVTFERAYVAYQEKNFTAAAAAWTEAAAAGSAGAMYNLGVLHEKGEGVPFDLPLAMTWFEKAAANGYKDAQASVARLKPKLIAWDDYQKGKKAEDAGDYEEALTWYEKTAAQGSTAAMMALGGFYEEGLGVDENPRTAIEWYKKAAEKGEPAGTLMAQMLEETLPMYDLMASQREMKRLRDQIDGVASGAATGVAATGASAGKTTKELRKNRPWTAEEVRAALKDGADQRALSQAIKADKLEKTFTDLELKRLLNTPEGRLVEDFSPLSQTLHEHVYPGAGAWTFEMAKAAIEARRAQVGRVVKVVDSPELRAKAAAGDAAALLELYLMPEEQRTQGAAGVLDRLEIARKIEEQKYVRGYWLVADTLRNNPDKTKNDPVRRAELLFQGAEGGDPRAMRELAMEFIASSDTAVATNYAEAEYWMIEAAARAPEGTMEDAYVNPGRDVAFFYSFGKTTGGPVAWPMSNADEATLRWARELIRRGGKLADVANVHLDAFELEPRSKDARAKMAALPPEVPLWSAAELSKLEAAAKAGDAAAAVKLGDGYATGRGVRQWDGKAIGYYEMAAAKGSVPVMRALAEHYFKGRGVKKDGVKRVAWLEKAGEAGDASAWKAAGDLLHYGVQDPKTEQDFPQAIALYQKAVAKGHGPAMHALGVMHELGRGGPKDLAKAAEWFRKAADAGERFSMAKLGHLAKEEKKYADAAEWYGKAAEAGEEHGRFWQAQMWGAAGDRVRAIPLLRDVVAKTPGNSTAWLELGGALHDSNEAAGAKEAYRKVIELVGEDHSQGALAKELLGELEAAVPAAPSTAAVVATLKENQNADELLQSAQTFAALQARAEAEKALHQAAAIAETGTPETQYRLAGMIMQGTFGIPKDEARGRALLQSAAEGGFASAKLDYASALMQGALGFAAEPERGRTLLNEVVAEAENANPDAKFQIGMLLYQGTVVSLDKARGIALIESAANANVPAALFEFGRALMTGLPEVPANPGRGVQFLKRAAERGLPQAAAVLGQIYEKGMPLPAKSAEKATGVTADLRAALKWYEQALNGGVQQVKPAVERLQLELSGKGPRPAGK